MYLCRLAVLVPLVILVECLYTGDSCITENGPGRCSPLYECQPLLSEIERSGTPMPVHLRKKLQSLSCGFEYDEPLVCCPVYLTTDDGNSETNFWPPSTHGLGVSDSTNHRHKPTVTDAVIDPCNTNNNGVHTKPTESSNNNIFDKTDIDNNKSGNTDNNNNNDGPPDIKGHRNLRLLPTECGPIEEDRIYGGKRTALFEMPWMVLIAYDSARGTKLSCGGTLISKWYVLTAAHCVSFLGNRLKLAGVILGEYDVRSDPDCERIEGQLYCAPSVRNVSIDTVIPHPGYSPQNLFDDIALIRLSEPADLSLDNMKAICLPITPEVQRESLVGQEGVVAGWGATEDGLQSSVLLSVTLPIISNKDCDNVYNGNPRIYDRQICAGGVPDKDSCGGDSGGPLMFPGRIGTGGIKYVQRGIVSYGSKRCGIGGFPGVYTRVAYYMDWILDNISD